MQTLEAYGPSYWIVFESPITYPDSLPDPGNRRNLGNFSFSAPPLNQITGETGVLARAQEGPRTIREYGSYQIAPYQLDRGGNWLPQDSRIQRFDGANLMADILPVNPYEIEPFYFGE
jgi:hypothetical protein